MKRQLTEVDETALGHNLDANIAAIRSVPSPDIALANLLVMGAVILARGLDGQAPYAVKVHGSASPPGTSQARGGVRLKAMFELMRETDSRLSSLRRSLNASATNIASK